MRLYNTLTRTEEDFAPSRDGVVRMYACGLTVYARGHIGNFRTFTAVDVLRRTLRHVARLPVHGVMNFTDVDDRTILESNKAGVPLREYTDTYVKAFHEDAATLGLEEIEDRPRATDEANLRAMSDMVAALEQNGHTYRSDGSIYFRIASLPDYGKLARLDHSGIQAGRARRLRQVRQGERPRLRAVEGDPARRADLGLRHRSRPPRLAHRVLGDGAAHPRRGADRHPLRRHRPRLPAPRERDRAGRGRHQAAVLALLVPRRTSADGRREDVEVARQRLQRQGPDRSGPPPVDAALPAAVGALPQAAEVLDGDAGAVRRSAQAADGLPVAARHRHGGRRASRRRRAGGGGPDRVRRAPARTTSTRRAGSACCSTWCAA